MTGRRNAAALWTIVVLAVLAGMSIVPTSYYLIAPGSAVELAGRITVRAHRAPARRYYLTDVTIARASVLLLAGRLLPGTRVVRRETVLPARQNARSHDRMLVDAMDDSQNVAALVAERAAGYRIDVAPPRFIVGDLPPPLAPGASCAAAIAYCASVGGRCADSTMWPALSVRWCQARPCA